jgi:RNA polymerase sigma factor (sigma-70 family)
MTVDTWIGGPSGRFPQTSGSLIGRLSIDDPPARALAYGKVVAAYWKPAYKHLRLKWRLSNEDAKDLVQAFFTRAIDRNSFCRFDPSRATFRAYLQNCLDRFAANERRSTLRFKRGGAATLVPLDFEAAERELRCAPTVEDCFHREWVRRLFELAIATLRERCQAQNRLLAFRVFERYDLQTEGERPTYDHLAREFEVSPAAVTNYLAAMRRDLRRIVIEKLREITSGEQEFRREARALLGIRI